MAKKKYDFCGWATKCGVKCADGRTIMPGAFDDNNGQTVPLVWEHDHKSADNVLGHALLETRDNGVYAYCNFNNTPQGENAKELVRNGDIKSLSIFANKLKQNSGGEVYHGYIRELSLVLAGANPQAYIEEINIQHSEGSDEFEAVIYTDDGMTELTLSHSEEENEEVLEHMDEENKQKESKQEETKQESSGKSIQDIIDTMNEEQKTVLNYVVGLAVEEGQNADDEGDNEMKHNVFDNEGNVIGGDGQYLSHSDLEQIVENAKACGSLKKAYQEYAKDFALQHGITNVENLMPDSKVLPGHPLTLNDDTEWVSKVISKVHHTPFAKVKSRYFDITGDEARARGYVKGDQKIDEVITALQRETTPQTVYKHQSMDRDDIIDITDFDVVAYLKAEMQGKLDEELARAYLIGDGRTLSDKYKIKPTNIRPILGDDPTYSVSLYIDAVDGEDDETLAKRFMKFVKKNRKNYKGKGSPDLFTTEDMLSSILCIEDKNGRVIYDTVEQAARAMRVNDIITVPPMELAKRTADGCDYSCIGIMVNLADYNVGMNAKGDKEFFNQFDIDYNKEKYLIETRQSGALVVPKSALTFELKTKKATSSDNHEN